MAVYIGLFVLAGFMAKLSAAPFHYWTPDTYQGAPTPVTAWLSVGSKGAGFVMAIRLLVGVMAPLGGALVLRGYPTVTLIAIMASLLADLLSRDVPAW